MSHKLINLKYMLLHNKVTSERTEVMKLNNHYKCKCNDITLKKKNLILSCKK